MTERFPVRSGSNPEVPPRPGHPGREDGSRTRQWSAYLQHSPHFYVAVGFATIVGSAAAVLALFVAPGRDSSGEHPPTTSQSTSTRLAPTQAKPSHQGTPVDPGTCLDDDLRVTECALPHRYEVFASRGSPCSVTDAVRYLGGHPAHDVLVVDPMSVAVADGATVCALRSPAGVESDRAAKGVLATPAGAGWRHCLDERTGLDRLPCSTPHTAELVGASTAPDAAACRAAAEAYMGVSFDRVSDRLVTAVLPVRQDPAAPRCVVRVLGNAVLTDTLRNVRARALPITAPE